RRVVLEDKPTWPAEVKALFAAATANIAATPRSPWQHTAGIPKLERAPSARAACRYCQEKSATGGLRLAREPLYGMRPAPIYFHPACYARSDDFHGRMLELVVLRCGAEITREEVAGLAAVLPPEPEEDDDVLPLIERLLALYDAVPREQGAPDEPSGPQLTEN